MEISLLAILMVGFILGFKHAIEPDHIVAVSTIACKSKKIWRSTLAGVCWGIGHTATLFIAGMILIALKIEISAKWALSLEFIVGIMIVYLGVSSLLSYRKKKIHVHEHDHSGYSHTHFHELHDHPHQNVSYMTSVMIGMVHGLAGSAAMVLLTMTTVNSLWEGIAYILVFGLGTILGMLLFTTLIGLPFVLSANKTGINHALIRITGIVSTIFGLYLMYDLGFSEGLFKLWLE